MVRLNVSFERPHASSPTLTLLNAHRPTRFSLSSPLLLHPSPSSRSQFSFSSGSSRFLCRPLAASPFLSPPAPLSSGFSSFSFSPSVSPFGLLSSLVFFLTHRVLASSSLSLSHTHTESHLSLSSYSSSLTQSHQFLSSSLHLSFSQSHLSISSASSLSLRFSPFFLLCLLISISRTQSRLSLFSGSSCLSLSLSPTVNYQVISPSPVFT